MTHILLIVLFSLFWMNTTQAQSKTKAEWALHIDTSLGFTYFPEENGSDTNSQLTKLELAPSYLWKYGSSWRLFLKPTFIANPDNKSTIEHYFTDPTEAYIKYQGDSLNIQVGYITTTWGVTDGYNPLDLVNSKQYFDPLHSRKLGAPSLAFSQTSDWLDWDLIYIPQNRGALLPGENSRWLPREVYVPLDPDNNLVLLLPDVLRYHYKSKQNLNQALDDNLALRIQKHYSNFDIGLYGFSGVAPLPLVQPEVTGTIVAVSPKTVIQVDPDIYLTPKNYRVNQGGFSFVSSQWDFLFKYATSYLQSQGDDELLPGWTHENVLGLEKTFSFNEGVVLAILQYAFLNSQKRNDSNVALSEVFRNTWIIGGKITWKEVWNFSLTGLYDNNHGSHYTEFIIGRRLLDRWVLSLTASTINGDRLSPLGVYSKNDSYSASLSASF